MLIRYIAVGCSEDGLGDIIITPISPPSLSTTFLCIASLEWYGWQAHWKTSYDTLSHTFVDDFELIVMNEDMRQGCTLDGETPALPTLHVTGVDDSGYQMLTMYVSTEYLMALELHAKREGAWIEGDENRLFSKREKGELGSEYLCAEDEEDSEMDDSAAEDEVEDENMGNEDEDVGAEAEDQGKEEKAKGKENKDDEDDYFEVMAEKKTHQRVD
ncbi:MAG: hypothetical protein Q9208_001176 [Pyrenodesmia sp. 3 TL-2023]